MKKLALTLAIILTTIVSYTQVLYIPNDPDSIKVPINVLGTPRNAYVIDLTKKRVSLTKHTADSAAMATLIATKQNTITTATINGLYGFTLTNPLLKLNTSDTSAMLTNYRNTIATNTADIALKANLTDIKHFSDSTTFTIDNAVTTGRTLAKFPNDSTMTLNRLAITGGGSLDSTDGLITINLAGVGGGTVDATLIDGSTNAIQNNAVYDELQQKLSITDTTRIKQMGDSITFDPVRFKIVGDVVGTVNLADSASTANALATKQGTVTVTTIGTTGPASMIGDVINIPQYQAFSGTTSGDIVITDSTRGIVLTAPDASTWRVKVSNTGTLYAISVSAAPPEALNFTSVSGTFTQSPTGTWGNSGYGVATKSLPASTDGWIEAEYGGTANQNAYVGLASTSAVNQGAGGEWEYTLFVDPATNMYSVYGLGYSPAANFTGSVTAAAGDLYRLKRTGSTITAEYYRGGTWNLGYTFSATTSSQLYVKGQALFSSGTPHYLLNPKGKNLQ